MGLIGSHSRTGIVADIAIIPSSRSTTSTTSSAEGECTERTARNTVSIVTELGGRTFRLGSTSSLNGLISRGTVQTVTFAETRITVVSTRITNPCINVGEVTIPAFLTTNPVQAERRDLALFGGFRRYDTSSISILFEAFLASSEHAHSILIETIITYSFTFSVDFDLAILTDG